MFSYYPPLGLPDDQSDLETDHRSFLMLRCYGTDGFQIKNNADDYIYRNGHHSAACFVHWRVFTQTAWLFDCMLGNCCCFKAFNINAKTAQRCFCDENNRHYCFVCRNRFHFIIGSAQNFIFERRLCRRA